MKIIIRVLLVAALVYTFIPVSAVWADESVSYGQGESSGPAAGTEAESSGVGVPEAPTADASSVEAPAIEFGLRGGHGDSAGFQTLEAAQSAGAVAAVPGDSHAYVEGEILVVLAGQTPETKELAAVEDSIEALSDTGASVETAVIDSSQNSGQTVLVELPADVSVKEALLQVANDENVVFAQPNFLYTLSEGEAVGEFFSLGTTVTAPSTSGVEPLFVPNDPFFATGNASYPYQWWLTNVETFGAWNSAKTNRAVTVAVVDTGIRLTHLDLKGNIITNLAWDAYRDQSLQTSVTNEEIPHNGDLHGHGTHVAGIVAAEADNNVGGAGVSYNAKILPINIFYEVFDEKGNLLGISANSRTLIVAYNYIMAHRQELNIRVVNLSLGGEDDPAVHAAIQEANNAGILTVCAAGNAGEKVNVDDDNAPTYPSDYDECVSVTSVDQSNTRASYSEHNAHKDIAAPGSVIYSTYSFSDESFAFMSGTSMASPVVAGVAALLFARNQNLTPSQAKTILYNTATDLGWSGWDKYYGWGLVNAQAAVSAVPAAVTSVTLNPTNKSLVASENFTLVATVTPSNATNRAVTWASSDTAVATVDANGKVIALKAGTATITVTTNDGANKATCAVVVTAATVPVTGVTLNATSKSLEVGATLTLAATVAPSNATNKAFTWSSGNTAAATVDTSGKVTALKAGTAIITVTTKDGNKKASCTVTITAPTVTETVPANGTYVIRTIDSYSTTKVFDVPGKSLANDTKINIWDYNRMPHQRFVFTRTQDGYYTIKNLNSGKLLDVPGSNAKSGVEIIQWSATGGDNQKWAITKNTDGSYTFSPKLNSALCLDIRGASKVNGAGILLYTKNNAANQRFALQKMEPTVASGTYTIGATYVNLVLDIEGAKTTNGTNVALWTPNGQNNQKFSLTYDATTGYYTIVNPLSGKALDVAGASGTPGANVLIWATTGANNQKWAIESVGDGSYRLYSACSGLLLDASGASKAPGTNVLTWSGTGAANQKWKFSKVG